MKEQFVTYEIALKLKELGFDNPCFGCYFKHDNGKLTFEPEPHKYPSNNYTHYIEGIQNSIYCRRDSFADFDKVAAPLWQQAIDWIRNVHKIHLEYVYSQDHDKYSWSGWDEYHSRELSKRPRVEGRFPYPYKSRFKEHYWNIKTYEEAREESILKTLELLKNYANENSI